LMASTNGLRKENVPISIMKLHLQGLDVSATYGVPSSRASWPWMKAFEARHNSSTRARTHQMQQPPENLARIAAALIRTWLPKPRYMKNTNTGQTATTYHFVAIYLTNTFMNSCTFE
ncbi:hypothetical protein PHYSODRAFT_518220, partial [Phytophthora sojae]